MTPQGGSGRRPSDSGGRPPRRDGKPGGSQRGGPKGGGRPGGSRGGPQRDAGAAPRGGAGRPAADDRRDGGTRLTPKTPRLPDPAIAEGVTGRELDRAVWGQLRTLSKENAEGVAQHLVMVSLLLDEDLSAASAHAESAVRRAGRVPAVREAMGLVAYRSGDFTKALTEFRTVRRLSGSSDVLPLMVDCERALGRPQRALELATSPEARTLARAEQVELAIVVSGIRRDLGQLEAAVTTLQMPELTSRRRLDYSARLYYAYADALLATGDTEGARGWFAKAVDADTDLTTDAAERLEELDGVEQVDLLTGPHGFDSDDLGGDDLGGADLGGADLGGDDLGGDDGDADQSAEPDAEPADG